MSSNVVIPGDVQLTDLAQESSLSACFDQLYMTPPPKSVLPYFRQQMVLSSELTNSLIPRFILPWDDWDV